jgi:hypothetical protein
MRETVKDLYSKRIRLQRLKKRVSEVVVFNSLEELFEGQSFVLRFVFFWQITGKFYGNIGASCYADFQNSQIEIKI